MMGTAWHGLLHALGIAGSMTWQVTWSLILGFTLSAIIEALVKKSRSPTAADDRPRSLATATGSAPLVVVFLRCGGVGRSLFRKGADFTAAMAFQFASTNLVIELGLILALLLGWQFTAAEFVGGPIMIVLHGADLPPAAHRTASAKRPVIRPTRACRVDGRPRRDGHERRRRQRVLAPAGQPERVHVGQPQLRHGMGRGTARHRHRAAHRRRCRGLDPDSFWQSLFSPTTVGRQNLGPARRH
jgi:uncharacterized membrane protein YraQ (UPF0718 family)